MFDAAQRPPPLFFLLGLPFLAVGLLFWLVRHRPWFQQFWHWPMKGRPELQTGFVAWMIGFSVLWMVGAGLGTFSEYFEARRSLATGATQLEGWVENFDPMPYEGHREERFTVEGISFAYSDYMVSPGFNQTASHGGPVHAGEYLRIAYAPIRGKNAILRLDVCR